MHLPDVPLKEIVKDYLKENACEEAIKWCKALLSKYPNIDYKRAIDYFLTDNTAPQSWAVWVLCKFGRIMTPELRLLLGKKIRDPMTALRLYADFRNFLTQDELTLLKKKFKGKRPRAEKELEEGVLNG